MPKRELHFQASDSLRDALNLNSARINAVDQEVAALIRAHKSIPEILAILNDRGDLDDREWTAIVFVLGHECGIQRAREEDQAAGCRTRSVVNFQTTGDTDQDDARAAQIRLYERRLAEGLCPNGCGPMEVQNPHNRECPHCHFHEGSTSPRFQA